jgi:hypothetical protein
MLHKTSDGEPAKRSMPLAAARAIAFYLPQFHPIPENDVWWGAGFTEWMNVRRARPLFPGHAQPRVPAELGYYDLRSAATREAQADLARAHGVEGFCYWHYWFAGKRVLEQPFESVVRSGEPRFPFCVAWANHDWTASWVGRPGETLIRQTYPGRADYLRHFEALRPAFEDERYLKVDGKPLFIIFRPKYVPELPAVLDLWRERAVAAGFPGLCILGILDPVLDPGDFGLDGSIDPGIGYILSLRRDVLQKTEFKRHIENVFARRGLSNVHQLIARASRPQFSRRMLAVHDRVAQLLLLPARVPHTALIDAVCANQELATKRFPCVVPNWDNTPRMGRWGIVLEGSTPLEFERHLAHAVRLVQNRPPSERLVFLKSWNEWAEGNYLEPDMAHGRGYLEAVRRVVLDGGRDENAASEPAHDRLDRSYEGPIAG